MTLTRVSARRAARKWGSRDGAIAVRGSLAGRRPVERRAGGGTGAGAESERHVWRRAAVIGHPGWDGDGAARARWIRQAHKRARRRFHGRWQVPASEDGRGWTRDD